MKSIPMPKSANQFDALGKLTLLWMNAPKQRDRDANAAACFLLPPVSLQQYILIERDGMPVAYCSWAWLSAEAEMRYLLTPAQLQAADWTGGDRLWFVDWIAPFAASDSRRLMRALKARFPHEVARSLQVKPGQERAHVREFRGPGLTAAEAEQRLAGYYGSFLDGVRQLARDKCANDNGVRAVTRLPVQAGRTPCC